MPELPTNGTRISINSSSEGEKESLTRHIRVNLIKFGTDISLDERKSSDRQLVLSGEGLPYLKDGKPWEYPFLKIISNFPEASIEVSYWIDGENQTAKFGQIPEKRSGRVVKLRPSDLTFLRNCPRCFYLRYNYGLNQVGLSVSGGMAKALADKEERALLKQTTDLWCPDINPRGVFLWQGETVVSAPLPVKGRNTYYFGGMFDLLAELTDGTHAVIDCKTTANTDGKLQKVYFLQLMAYRFCLENPADEKFCAALSELDGRTHKQPTIAPIYRRVDHIGLLCFNLNDGTIQPDPSVTKFSANVRHVPIQIDQDRFIELIQASVNLLEQETIPESGKYCSICNWQTEMNAIISAAN